MSLLLVPVEATGIQLCKIFPGDRLRITEAVKLVGGWKAIDTTLRRAAVSGRVAVDEPLGDYFADLLDESGDIIAHVNLDARSFKALKSKWLGRLKYLRST